MFKIVQAQVDRTRTCIYDVFVLKSIQVVIFKIYQNYCWNHTSGMQKKGIHPSGMQEIKLYL